MNSIGDPLPTLTQVRFSEELQRDLARAGAIHPQDFEMYWEGDEVPTDDGIYAHFERKLGKKIHRHAPVEPFWRFTFAEAQELDRRIHERMRSNPWKSQKP